MSMYYVAPTRDANGNATGYYKNILEKTNASTVGKNATNKGATLRNSTTNAWNAGTTTAQKYAASLKNDDDTIPAATTSNEVSSDTLDAYYSALIDKLSSANSARDAALNAAYEDNLSDINGRYARLKRILNRKAVNNGQDPYVTNAWNTDYAKDTSKRELDKAKLEAQATNTSSDFSNYSSIYNSLLNSNASDSLKKKLLSYA